MEAVIILGLIIIYVIWRKLSARGIHTISVEQLKEVIHDKDKVFVDVRTQGEYKDRHISQFNNIPLGSDFSKLPKDKDIVVICQSGMRSGQACRQLKKIGYKHVTNVRGGMNAWRG